MHSMTAQACCSICNEQMTESGRLVVSRMARSNNVLQGTILRQCWLSEVGSQASQQRCQAVPGSEPN